MSDQLGPYLRAVRDDDLNFLKKVFFTSRQRVFAAANLSAHEQEKILEHQFAAQISGYRAQAPQADYYVVMLGDNECIGRIYLDRRKQEIGLMEMALLPDYRNRKIGTALIREVLKEAQETGKSVVLHVEQWNPEARRLYQRLGFEDEEDIGTHWRMRWHPEEA